MDAYSVDWFIAFFFALGVILTLLNLRARIRRLEQNQETRGDS
jgi:hypothetical protein